MKINTCDHRGSCRGFFWSCGDRFRKDSAVVLSVVNEAKFICTFDHPNICDCHGAVTRQEGDLLLWMVMEKFDMNLHTTIMDKDVQHDHDTPGPFAEILEGSCVP